MIKELKAEASFGVIKDTFEWKNIPNFAVITGENGSGKTQLLRQIAGLEEETKIFPKINTNKVGYWHGKDFGVKEIPDYDKETLEGFLREMKALHGEHNHKYETIEDIIENNDVNKYYLKWIERNKDILKDFFQTPFKELERRIRKCSDKNFYSEISLFNPQYFVNVVVEYHLRYDQCRRNIENQDENISVKDLEVKIEEKIGKNPLKKINDILKGEKGEESGWYNKFTIETKCSHVGIIPFCKDQEGNEIPFEQLSTGEQVILALLIWRYNDSPVKPTTILLDEPDAFLNPKMSRMLIDTIKNDIIGKSKEYQVIMTTHSMVTVAQVGQYKDKDEHLFYMENGEIYKTSRNESLNRLSQGFVAQEMFNFVGRLMKCSYFLCVEGASDKIHLEKCPKYKEILVGNNGVLEIVDCGGADSMEYYANFFKNFKNGLTRKALFIFDYDSKGMEAKNKVENVLSQDNAFSQHNTMFVSEGQALSGNQFFTIENCYGDDQRVMQLADKKTPPCKWSSDDKMRFANRRSKEEREKSGLSILIKEIKKKLDGLKQFCKRESGDKMRCAQEGYKELELFHELFSKIKENKDNKELFLLSKENNKLK